MGLNVGDECYCAVEVGNPGGTFELPCIFQVSIRLGVKLADSS